MLLEPDRVTFALMQRRLLEVLRQRLRNGDFTERGLARSVGLSQPHVHNVLKGARGLSPDVGDLLIAGLDLSLIELLGADELGEALMAKQMRRQGTHSVPVLVGRIGPDDPFPSLRTVGEWVVTRGPELSSLRRPAFARLGADPAISPEWIKHGYALLDFDEASRAEPGMPAWYVLRWRGAGYVRQVCLRDRTLVVLGQQTLEGRDGPESMAVEDGTLLQVVRGRLVWVGPDPMPAGSLSQSGVWLPRAARS